MGHYTSWPAYYGGLAMTYENGSTRGLVVKKADEATVTFRETVRRHFVASISTCETAAVNREKLLENFYQYHVSAIEEGSKEPVREYILPRRGNVSAVDRLAALMVQHGAEVMRAAAPFKNGNAEYPAGSYVIPLAQPAKRLVRTFLDPQISMDDPFLKEEERRRRLRLSSEIYDVTAWSLPLQFGVDAIASGAKSQGRFDPFDPATLAAGTVIGDRAAVAYLVPWGTTAAARFLTGALRNNLRVYSSDKKFVLAGRTYTAGTLILKVKENPDSLHDAVQKIAKSSQAEVVATDTGWVEEGPNFGSRRVVFMRKPAIALAWDRPVLSSSAGQLRFVIERQFGYPVTVIRTDQLASADLSKFQVVVLPDTGSGAGYSAVLGANGARHLKDWVESGGTLIGIDGALEYLASSTVGLLSVSQENRALAQPESPAERQAGGASRPAGSNAPPPQPVTPGPVATSGVPRVPGKLLAKDEDLEKAVQPETELPSSAHGFLATAKVDPEHWITVGVPEKIHAMVTGQTIFAPIKIDRGWNAAVFAGPDQVMASGYTWDDYRKQIAYKPFMVVQRDGRGFVIGFTADPNFRAYMDGLNVLFVNALFRAPAHTGRGAQFGENEW